MENDTLTLHFNLCGIHFFMVPFPRCLDQDMTLPKTIYDGEVEYFLGNEGNTCFFVLLQSDRVRTENIEAKTQAALEYIWSKLVEYGSATGPMPEASPIKPHDLQRLQQMLVCA